MPPPFARKPWTDLEQLELKACLATGMTFAQAAKRLGRGAEAVRCRAVATGLWVPDPTKARRRPKGGVYRRLFGDE